MYSAQS